METISGFRLFELLKEQNTIKDKKVEIDYHLTIDVSTLITSRFRNCVFTGKNLTFTSLNKEYAPPILLFINCEFNIDQLEFSNCSITSIFFRTVIIKNYLSFNELNLGTLNITSNCKIQIIESYSLKISNRFYLNKNNEIKSLLINDSNFEGDFNTFKTQFEYLNILDSKFKNFYCNNNSLQSLNIERSNFLSFNLNSNQFLYKKDVSNLNLLSNQFNEITSFSVIKADKFHFFIKDCDFKKFVRFNNSNFKVLHIEETNFNDISSFQDTSFESIFIDRTNFDKTSYFDDISISNIKNCNKRTLRNIKHQLQRTNNKIDFDRFKSYEIGAYREELKKDKKFWYNDKDAFILSISNLFSNNGTNWFKAFIVTVIGSFIFYSLFFWININSFQLGNFDFSKIDSFVNGFSKFLIPTNIYNPLIDRKFVTGWSFFPFILGKIFLSIGIYEVIVSFRKFKS
jgi:hypothetical protein